MTPAQNQKSGKQKGFTLIELLVVVAIISLLASVALIAMQSAREKSRNVKRLADMTQMNTALELYFASYRGYPSGTFGQPSPLVPEFLIKLPTAPEPADGNCDSPHSAEVTANNGGNTVPANAYYYLPEGPSADVGGVTVYPSYSYFFCLGDQTGNYGPGERILTPSKVQ